MAELDTTNDTEKPLLDDIENHPAVQEWNNLAYSNQQEQEQQQTSMDEMSEDSLNPKRTIFHRYINLIRTLVVICAINMGAGEILSFIVMTNSPSIIETTLRVYEIVFCIVIILNELEWLAIVTNNALLKNWISRGLFYSFIGVVGLEEFEVNINAQNLPNADSDGRALYIQAVDYCMFVSGLIYFVMGLFCMQKCYQSTRDTYEKKMESARARQEETGGW